MLATDYIGKLFLPVLLSLTACQTISAPVASKPIFAKKDAEAPLQLKYKKGQLLTLIFLDRNDGKAGAVARKKYYETVVFPAEGFGLRLDATFSVKAIGVGSFKPEAVVVYSWPDKQAENKLAALPEWPKAKTLRSQGWDRLRSATSELDANMTLSFDPNKTYSIATAWLNPDFPDDYERYMSGIQAAVTKVGGKFIYKMQNPIYETHTKPFAAPDQITLVEWDSPASLAAFRETEGFKQNAKYLTSGTRRFELLLLSLSP